MPGIASFSLDSLKLVENGGAIILRSHDETPMAVLMKDQEERISLVQLPSPDPFKLSFSADESIHESVDQKVLTGSNQHFLNFGLLVGLLSMFIIIILLSAVFISYLLRR